MARSSFNSIYTDILHSFLREKIGGKIKRDYITFFTLWYIGSCCDRYNESFPHPETISDAIGYAVESVYASLQKLIDLDLIRMQIVYNPRTHRDEHLFQISTAVRYVSDNDIENVNVMYSNKPSREDVTRFFMKESYLVKIPISRPKNRPNKTSLNNVTEPPPPPPIYARAHTPPIDIQTPQEGLDSNDSDNDQRNAQRNQPTRSGSSKTPPVSAPPPVRTKLEPDQEVLAERVKWYGTGIRQARGLIVHYGYDAVKVTLAYVENAVTEGTSTNPMGLLVAKLRQRALENGELTGVDYRLKQTENAPKF